MITTTGKSHHRSVLPDPVPASRKISAADLAKVCARVLIRDGLTCDQERAWRRLAEPGDPPRAILDYGMNARTAVVPRALRAAGADYGGCSVKAVADAVVEALGPAQANALELEIDRLRAENRAKDERIQQLTEELYRHMAYREVAE